MSGLVRGGDQWAGTRRKGGSTRRKEAGGQADAAIERTRCSGDQRAHALFAAVMLIDAAASMGRFMRLLRRHVYLVYPCCGECCGQRVSVTP
jgi:hypothetical protein